MPEQEPISILRCCRKIKTILSGSVVTEAIHRAKRVLSACELVVILGVLRTSSLVQGGDCWKKNNPEGKRTFERRDEPNVTAQISWSLAALEPLWGGRQREHLEKRNVLCCCLSLISSAGNQCFQWSLLC